MPNSIFVCQQCGKIYPKWQGRCDNCGTWSSLVEEAVIKGGTKSHRQTHIEPTTLSHVSRQAKNRMKTGMSDVDAVLGGGIVTGSIVLLGGEPGIGKSTLLLQIAAHVKGAVYITGEESLEQVSMRADRLGIKADLGLIQETDAEQIIGFIEHAKPALVIIDSIQTVISSEYPGVAGSIIQVRTAAQRFQMVAKNSGVPILLVGHVTKEGTIAGPRTLEHIVDVVLSFEGSAHENSRVLRGIKNRFGATNEVAILSMEETGLRPVANPSKLFLSDSPESVPGSAVTCILEGRRPLLVEVQALTVPTNFGYPKRTAVGFDSNRLNVLVAVLQRRARLRLEQQDVYVNVVGGIRIQDPSADLAVCMAIASALHDVSLPKHGILMGEVGLLGEIRTVSRSTDRQAEARRLGYTMPKLERTLTSALHMLAKKSA